MTTSIDANLAEQLFRDRILILEGSARLVAENRKLESIPGATEGLDLSCLKSSSDWQGLRDTISATIQDSLPDRLRERAARIAFKAENLTIAGEDHEISIRLIEPEKRIRGALLHIHGGAWVAGNPEDFDFSYAPLVDDYGIIVASVDYRLAPQHKHPAAVADCQAAATWLSRFAREHYQLPSIFIRGESAGAHLAALTALRLCQDETVGLSGIICEVGLFDHTNRLPSRFGSPVTGIRASRHMTDAYLEEDADPEVPDISPVYASVDQLRGLPPALFLCAERDGFCDDSLLMFARWLQSGNEAFIGVVNGCGHNLLVLDAPEADIAQDLVLAFVNRYIGGEGATAGDH